MISQQSADNVVKNNGITRREALRVGLYTATSIFLGRFQIMAGMNSNSKTSEFLGSLKGVDVWELWRRRGWVKEARHYEKAGEKVMCKLCPNFCVIGPGGRSRCRNKVNCEGLLYTLAYGNPCAFHVDPIEKKPLYHFLPGTKTFSIATSGCVFRCLNCQNWEISQSSPEETKDPSGEEIRLRPPLPERITYDIVRRASMFPEDVVAIAQELKCPSVSYTYSEPTAFYEYAQDTAKLAKEAGLKNVFVTCGSINEQPLRDLYRYADAAHVDLKGFDEQTYRRLNAGRLQAVLNAIKVMHQMGVWIEIVNLVVPTYTDDLEKIKRMCGWIVKEVGPDVPLHFSRFFPHYKLTHLYPTPLDTLEKAREIAFREGLRYVYVGNVPEFPEGGHTKCPNCKKVIAERTIYGIAKLEIESGKCKYCGQKIPGVW